MREEHGNRGSTDDSYLDEAENERTLATMPQTFEKVIDNRLYVLHQARFLPGPFNWKQAIKKTLVKQVPVCGEANFNHIGMTVLNERTIRAAHDRSNTSIHLKLFTTDNLRLSKAEQDRGLVLAGGRLCELKDIHNICKAIKACYNYEKI